MSPQLATLLLDRFPVGLDALICRDGIGRLHPLCGIYAKKTLPQLERHLSAGSYRMQGLLEELHCVYLNTAKLVPDEAFINLNTPEEYQGFLAHKIIKQIDADGVL